MITATARPHRPIWSGRAGLTIGGTLLRPDLTSLLTQIKLALVGTLTIYGMQAGLLTHRMIRHVPVALPPRLLA